MQWVKKRSKWNEFYSKTQQAPLAAPPYKVVAIDQPNQNANQIITSRNKPRRLGFSYLVKMEAKQMKEANMQEASAELRNFMKNKIGYRSDDYSECAWDVIGPKPIEILTQEISDIGNKDIQDTIKLLYGVTTSKPDEVDQFVQKQLGSKNYKLIWLTDTKENDQQYADDPDSIYSVDLHGKELLPISDLAAEGFLIAYKN